MAIDLNDKSPNANVLTNNGAIESSNTPFVASTVSVDLELSEGDYLYIDDVDQTGLDITGDISIELWVNVETLPSTAASQYVMVCKWDGGALSQRSYYFIIDSVDRLQFIYSDDGSFSAGHLTSYVSNSVIVSAGELGTWIHLSATVDVSAASIILYKNGSSVTASSTSTDATSIYSGSGAFTIGASNKSTTPTFFFDGLMDEIRVWDDIRTPTEISNNKDVRLTGSETNLQFYAPFEALPISTTDFIGYKSLLGVGL